MPKRKFLCQNILCVPKASKDAAKAAAKVPKANQRNSYRFSFTRSTRTGTRIKCIHTVAHSLLAWHGEKRKGNAEVVISHKSMKPKNAQRVEHWRTQGCARKKWWNYLSLKDKQQPRQEIAAVAVVVATVKKGTGKMEPDSRQSRLMPRKMHKAEWKTL